jgi:hypothetical protein
VTFFPLFAYRTKFFSCPFLFLPKFRSLGCYENVTTFHFGPLPPAKVFHGAILPQSVRAMCNEIVTTFMIEKPTSQGMARPCFGKWGVIKLTANRGQFSPISLKRGRKQAKLPDPLWDEGHYRIGFRRPSQDWRIRHFRPASRKPIAQPK